MNFVSSTLLHEHSISLAGALPLFRRLGGGVGFSRATAHASISSVSQAAISSAVAPASEHSTFARGKLSEGQ